MDQPGIPRESADRIGSARPGTGPAGRGPVPSSPDLVSDAVLSRPLAERMQRAKPRERIGVVIEVNADHPGGAAEAVSEVVARLREVAPGATVRRGAARSSRYVSAGLTSAQIRRLVSGDQQEATARVARGTDLAPDGSRVTKDPSGRSRPPRPAPRWAIHRIWPNFEVHNLIHRSVATTKCDAAGRAFAASGSGIVWAVLDSGIQGDHPHFERHANLALPGTLQHRSFVEDGGNPLVDEAGHGTHVAGIIAGEQVAPEAGALVAATWYQDENDERSGVALELDRIAGMAPRTTLLSCQVLRADGSGDVAALLDALEYIAELNQGGRELAVHGINLSVGYPFDPSWFGTGLTPVCREVDRLVRSGVLVVAAAGNTGYGYALDDAERQMRLPFGMTVNDPGNAERAVTVGSTSTRPHTTGVSYFSSKGPTGDGRLKPDLVAPGERIVSAGAGKLLEQARAREPSATYVEDSGTSMAAPHVSGVAAAFLSVHREFIGRPEEVKRILKDTATDLGRASTFQGAGLVDAMRAIQSV
jgi:subtilisin family serine protease